VLFTAQLSAIVAGYCTRLQQWIVSGAPVRSLGTECVGLTMKQHNWCSQTHAKGMTIHCISPKTTLVEQVAQDCIYKVVTTNTSCITVRFNFEVHGPPRPGFPKLSLAMYPFSISIDEHVPLNMSAGRIFPREGPIVDFPVVGQKYFCRGGKWQNYIFTTRN